MEFYQDGPRLENSFHSDLLLQSYLRRVMPVNTLAEIQPGLEKLGKLAVTEMLTLAEKAETEKPRHVPYDPWGRRIDDIAVSDAWLELDRIAAREAIVATGYERKQGALSRAHQFARLYLYAPSSAYYACPLAMTDGAARAIELYGDEALKNGAFRHLISRDPSQFWTSGQWMTERSGGSDVSGTETIARKEGDHYRLYGTKWFTSATTSQMAMTLARIEGAPEGSRGLSLFYLELRDAQGKLNGIRVNRLKDKLGTQALPTAELTLEGTVARLVGGEGNGVRKISSLFNITRVYNAICAVASMRRAVDLARDYSKRRVAFGKPISEQPLHAETLEMLETETAGALLLTFKVAELLGKEETGGATQDETTLLRVLTPIAKLYTGKQVAAVTSEVLECMGGAGYIEDTGFPRLLRDAQVLSIWEGTTNVLSLDMLRAFEKEGAFVPLMTDLQNRLKSIVLPELVAARDRALSVLQAVKTQFARLAKDGPDAQQAQARRMAIALGDLYGGAALLEHAQWAKRQENDSRWIPLALRWTRDKIDRERFLT